MTHLSGRNHCSLLIVLEVCVAGPPGVFRLSYKHVSDSVLHHQLETRIAAVQKRQRIRHGRCCLTPVLEMKAESSNDRGSPADVSGVFVYLLSGKLRRHDRECDRNLTPAVTFQSFLTTEGAVARVFLFDAGSRKCI